MSEAWSSQKPWSKMTDDEKLVATLLFMVLFVAQLILLFLVTLSLGLLWAESPIDVPVRWSRLLLDYAPALTGIMFALLFFAWTPLRRSGQWIWVFVVLLGLRFGLRQEILGRTPIDIAVNTPALACILYSVTMFAMNRRLKKSGAAISEPRQ